MGEYARRISDGQEVKIGTCESMYYLRYEHRHEVEAIPDSLNPQTEKNLFWRLPFPDEDETPTGEYKDYNRGYRLYKQDEDDRFAVNFSDPTTADSPGTIQLTHESGLLVNVKCYHGERLPESTDEVKAFWNGKSWFYELAHIKNMEDGRVLPVVRCRHCGKMWRYDWADIVDYIHGEMKERLAVYGKDSGVRS